MTASLDIVEGRAPAHFGDLFAEIGDLKRIRSAGRDGSIAVRGFCGAWQSLVAGDDARVVMRRSVAAGLAAVRLGDLDAAKLAELGLPPDETIAVLRRSFDAVCGGLDVGLVAELRQALPGPLVTTGRDLPFVRDLVVQPRAGATCPGKPRLVLEPPENHAEHCWVVAVLGVLLSPVYGADPTVVFLAALAHHLHNASMPDSGFTGEVLLGDHLDAVIERANQRALAQMPAPLRAMVEAARRILPDAATPEGRAFHAADVIDRVMQLAQHLRPASIGMAHVLDTLELVHDGPVKPFHDAVLADMGLP